eukprot:g5923.t1
MNGNPANRYVEFGPEARSRSMGISPFGDNVVITSLYTFWNFVPKSLFQQFQRLANYFFLIIGLLMLFGSATDLYGSPLHPWGTLISLMLVMLFTMFMQARDDIARHRNDAEVNSRPARCVNKNETIEWRAVRVGDIIVVKNREYMPADLVVLATSEKAGISYVETSNIDGETNLKIRSSIEGVHDLLHENADSLDDLETVSANAISLSGVVGYEEPNKFINSFKGFFEGVRVQRPGEEPVKFQGANKVPLTQKQLLLRGSMVRNTRWIVGLVVYTGRDTKVARNSTTPPIKLSNLEKAVNNGLIVVLGAMFTLIIVSTVLSELWRQKYVVDKGDDLWYLFPDGIPNSFQLPYMVAYFLTFSILYNNFVPLSMYTTMEFINLMQAQMINRDWKMYDKGTDTPAWCRAANLVQELGQVAYIFSDKTGTLTQNVMKFKQCSIDGRRYGSMEFPEGFDSSKFILDLEAAKASKGSGRTNYEAMDEFLTIMAVAHTVVAETDEETGAITYEAESPDEGALCDGAASVGYTFVNRDAKTITVQVDGEEKPRVYEVLAINAFNSKRKRMSVVVRRPDGSLVLLAKGADSVMLDPVRCHPFTSNRSAFDNDLLNFAQQGLRTLVLSKRELTEKQFSPWYEKFKKAMVALEDRSKLLEAAAEEIEMDMRVVGSTAIEDKLQDGVPETIELLARGGIKLWVATGDKMETAINIGRSCRLLLPPEEMLVLKMSHDPMLDDETQFSNISGDLQAICDALDLGNSDPTNEEGEEHTRMGRPATPTTTYLKNAAAVKGTPSPRSRNRKSLNGAMQNGSAKSRVGSEEIMRKRAESAAQSGANVTELALVITGGVLDFVLPDDNDTEEQAEKRAELERKLLKITQECSVVIACRVSPLQKAQIVNMVKNGVRIMGREPVTLSIGDGANDVGMIQAAQVGVGISGREGLQAANSADFSIAQFRFLTRLLLVHGRWNYRRMAKVIIFSFYKNFVVGLTLFFFNFLTAFSGTSLYETLVYAGYNVWLGLQPIAMGLFDTDVTAKTAVQYPELYSLALTEPDLDSRSITSAIILAVLHAAIL